MDIYLAKRSLLIRTLGILLLLSSSFCYLFLPNPGPLILTLCLSLNALLIYQSRHNKPVVIFYVFVFTYLWVLVAYYFGGRQITYHRDFRSKEFYDKGLYLFSIFLAFLSIFNNMDRQESFTSSRLKFKKDRFIFWLNTLIFLFIIYQGKTGQNIFESGGYGKGVVHSSSLNEYSLIFFLVAFIFSGGTRFKKNLLFVLGVVFCFKNILFGGRVEVLQIGLLIFILFFEKRISSLLFYIFVLFGIIAFTVFNHVRANPLLLLHPNIKDFFWGSSSVAIEASNQGDVFHATVRMAAMVDTGIINVFERIYSFLLFLISTIVPFSKLPPLANLASYQADKYSTGGGGLIFGYFYFWLSLPGIILIAYVLNKIFFVFLKSDRQVLLVYAILVLSTFPRWFAYIPVNLIKLCLLGTLYYFLTKALHNSLIHIMKNRGKVLNDFQ